MRKVFNVAINDEHVGDSLLNQPKWYKVWHNMLQRCYSEACQKKQPTYVGCSVCDEWLLASNFKKWFFNNYIEGYQLDKDIILDGNRIYSPTTCIFVPKEINILFVDGKAMRGDCPIGVSKFFNRYSSYISMYGKKHHLGYYDTQEEAHDVYIRAKHSYVREVAIKYYMNNKITKDIMECVIAKGYRLT